MKTVEVKGLVKTFDGHVRARRRRPDRARGAAVRALDGVDLAAEPGEYLVLLGPSGCGKTTLLRTIAGLEQPTEGDVLIDGNVVNGLPPRVRQIAMVFQSYALYPHKSVLDNIVFPLRAEGMARDERDKKARWAAELLEIEPLLRRKPRQLSGGERQRVALARALVRDPAVFLLDEPLSNLDAKMRATARDELKRFQERVGTTTIYVTHDQAEAMGLGDRIAVLEHGRVRQVGTPQEVYDDPSDTFVATFIGSPPMNLVRRDDVLVGFRPEHLLPAENVPGGVAAGDAAAGRADGVPVGRPARVRDGHRRRRGDPRHRPAARHRGDAAGVRGDARVRGALGAAAVLRRRVGRPHGGGAAGGRAMTHARTGPKPAAAAVPEARARAGLADREGFLAWVMLLPSVVYIIALVGVPFLLAIAFAFSDVTTGDPSFDFVGVRNFDEIFADGVFWRSLRNTLVFTLVSMVLIVVFGKILANILVADFRGKWFVRFLVLLPWTTPVALSTISWLWFLDSIYSPVDWVLRHLRADRRERRVAGPSGHGDGVGDRGADMAADAAGRGDRDGRAGGDPARHRRGGADRRRRVLAADVRGDDPADAAGDRGRRAVRRDHDVHRHDRPVRADPGRADALDGRPRVVGVLPRHRGRRRRAGRGDRAVPVPAAARGRGRDPARGPKAGGRMTERSERSERSEGIRRQLPGVWGVAPTR
ncbi:ATP-binding cassette domain-containing protein [Actinomadura madurae]|nr:ATP-binding cassette domain-containing protein [Actinomadura madurae]MCQ0018780.1 ATP-binding cassette domain-containing protein [Actinomadura madurae]